jgi:hypothetical protein
MDPASPPSSRSDFSENSFRMIRSFTISPSESKNTIVLSVLVDNCLHLNACLAQNRIPRCLLGNEEIAFYSRFIGKPSLQSLNLIKAIFQQIRKNDSLYVQSAEVLEEYQKLLDHPSPSIRIPPAGRIKLSHISPFLFFERTPQPDLTLWQSLLSQHSLCSHSPESLIQSFYILYLYMFKFCLPPSSFV